MSSENEPRLKAQAGYQFDPQDPRTIPSRLGPNWALVPYQWQERILGYLDFFGEYPRDGDWLAKLELVEFGRSLPGPSFVFDGKRSPLWEEIVKTATNRKDSDEFPDWLYPRVDDAGHEQRGQGPKEGKRGHPRAT